MALLGGIQKTKSGFYRWWHDRDDASVWKAEARCGTTTIRSDTTFSNAQAAHDWAVLCERLLSARLKEE